MAISNLRSGTVSFETGAGSDSMVGSIAGMSIGSGDLVLIFACCEPGTTVSLPSGFAEWVAGVTNSVKVFAKLAGGSESDYTVTFSATAGVKAVFVVAATGDFGAVLADVLDDTPVVVSGAAAHLPYGAYTPVNAGAAVLYFGRALQYAWGSVAPIADYTELVDTTSALGSDLSVAAGYRLSAPALSSGSMTVTTDDNTKSKFCVVLGIAEVAAAPTFTVSPTVSSQTASAYTLGYTADANATDLYVGAYAKDAAAPTASELKAGTGAHGTATEATTGSGDSLVLTPTDSPAFPLYDLYAVLEGAGGFSSVVALVDEFLDAPAGKQFLTLGTVSGTSPLSGASPAVASGDIWVLDLLSTPNGYTLTPIDTGDYTMDRGGDTSRQSFAHDVYDVSLAAYYGAGTVYDGNVAPTLIAGNPAIFNGLVFKKDEDQGTIALSASWQDQEGDALTYAVQSGTLPTGWSLAADGDLTGTPTVYGSYTWTTRVTDITGDFTDLEDTVVIGDEIPDVVDETEAAAITAIEAVANFTVTQPSPTEYSSTVAEGAVISQFPEAGQYVADDTAVTLTVSLGAAVTGFARPQIRLGIGLP